MFCSFDPVKFVHGNFEFKEPAVVQLYFPNDFQASVLKDDIHRHIAVAVNYLPLGQQELVLCACLYVYVYMKERERERASAYAL
jgi:hypothetical protein